MARMRYIKPGFFLNDELAEINPLGRILFEGLWCYADREGKLEDRPKRLKMEILPYDNCDINKYLEELKNREFIIRYSVNGNNYIKIKNWNKHQSPHVKEQDSIIPEPDKNSISIMQTPDKNDTSTPLTITDTDTDTDIYSAFLEFWNSLNIIKHKKAPNSGKSTLKTVLNNLLKDYDEKEIKESILNYSKIVKSDDYYFKYKWTITDFLLRGFEKFKDWDIAHNNFKIDKKTYTEGKKNEMIAKDGYKWEDFEEIEKDKWILKNE